MRDTADASDSNAIHRIATERVERLLAERSRKAAEREEKRTARRIEQEERKSAVAARKLARKPTKQLDAATNVLLASSESVDDEIVALTSTLTDRARDLVLQRWGYAAWPPSTLESLGEKYGITRERVRQITTGHNALIIGAGIVTPLLEQAAAILTAAGGVLSTSRLKASLSAARVNASDAALRTLPALSEAGVVSPIYFSEKYDLWLDATRKQELLVDGDFDGAVATMQMRARRALRRVGAVAVTRLAGTPPLDMADTGRLLWGDTSTTSISGYVIPHVQQDSVMSRAVAEMLAVTPNLPLADIAAGLLHVVPRPIKLPIPVLATVLRHHPAFRLNNGGVSLVTPLTPSEALSPAEADIVSDMQAKGGVMTWNELRVSLVTHGHTLAWLHALHQRPFLQRAGRRFYVLRGQSVPPDAASLADDGSPRPREWVLAHVQWQSDARCTVRYRVTPSTLRGVLLLPKKLAQRTPIQPEQWEAANNGSTIDALTVGAGMIWDLSSWMRSINAAVGDHIAITLDVGLRGVGLALVPAAQAILDEKEWAAPPDRPTEVRGPLTYRRPRRVVQPRVRHGRLVYDDHAWVRLPPDATQPPAVRCYRLVGAAHPAYRDVLIVTFEDFPLPPDVRGVSMGVIFRLPTMKGHRLGVTTLIEDHLFQRAAPLGFDEAMQLVSNLSEYLWRKRRAAAWREYLAPQIELLPTVG